MIREDKHGEPEATPDLGRKESRLGGLEALLGHSFWRKELLVRAVTHSSLAYERAAATEQAGGSARPEETRPGANQPEEDADNEQLEFLGDAVVGLLVAEGLCGRCPELKEGQLTRLRAALVSRRHLGEVAARLQFGKYLRLGKGEERSGGRSKNAILANQIEAVIGALYLDAGLDPVRAFVEREVMEPSLPGLLEQMERDSTIDDHKSALQELLQSRRAGPPQYAVKAESGPDHRKRFVVEVRVPGVGGRAIASGIGTTKKRAEQEAARRAFEELRSVEKEAEATPSTSGSRLAAPGNERAKEKSVPSPEVARVKARRPGSARGLDSGEGQSLDGYER